MNNDNKVECDGPWCRGTAVMDGDTLPEGWLKSGNKHYCPHTVRHALAWYSRIRIPEVAQ